MDTFRDQGNYEIKLLSTESNCELVIVPYNLTNFQPFDRSVNQAAQNSIRFNTWYGDIKKVRLLKIPEV